MILRGSFRCRLVVSHLDLLTLVLRTRYTWYTIDEPSRFSAGFGERSRDAYLRYPLRQVHVSREVGEVAI